MEAMQRAVTDLVILCCSFGMFFLMYHLYQAGNVTFDVNGDRGVAHYGLVPDFWKKMSTNSDIVDINATFNSAEAYIRMIGKVTNALPPYKNGVTNDMDVIRQNIGIRYGL